MGQPGQGAMHKDTDPRVTVSSAASAYPRKESWSGAIRMQLICVAEAVATAGSLLLGTMQQLPGVAAGSWEERRHPVPAPYGLECSQGRVDSPSAEHTAAMWLSFIGPFTDCLNVPISTTRLRRFLLW